MYKIYLLILVGNLRINIIKKFTYVTVHCCDLFFDKIIKKNRIPCTATSNGAGAGTSTGTGTGAIRTYPPVFFHFFQKKLSFTSHY